jgi:ribonuclease J
VAESLFRLVGSAPGRVIIASFASQISRVQIAADAARAAGRKLVVLGRSMVNNTRIARELSHLDVPPGLMVPAAEAASLPDEQVLIVTTGSQGEPSSGLVRMSRGQHREVRIKPGDTVIVSASVIPGNETAVNEAVDDLVRLGAKVITNQQARTHVSGHARREELRMVLNLARPQYFVPVHGDYRMLRAHADLAIDQGIPEEDVFLLTDGDLLELTADRGEVVDKLPAGNIFIHGLGIWDEFGNVIIERRALARDGIVTVALARKTGTTEIVGAPRIVSTGFVHTEDAEPLFKDTLDELRSVLDRSKSKTLEWGELENLVRRTVESFLAKRTRRHPLIIPVAIDV